MKEKPDLPDEPILNLLRVKYSLETLRLEFLPIGDISSAKYRVVTEDGTAYFLKLRKRGFKEVSVTVPHFLHAHAIHQVIAPLKTKDGRLWTSLEDYTCILYPFIDGHNGFQNRLSADQWSEFGAALKSVHAVTLPPELQDQVPSESFSPQWRNRLKKFLLQVEIENFEDPVAAKLAAGLREHRDEISFVIQRAEALGKAIQTQPGKSVLCHADIHAGNLLLEANGALHITDWDDPMLAPKERDLMFIGGGIGGIWNTAREEGLFYRGYGETNIDLTALAYYRFERIVSDIAEFCQPILTTTAGEADRERILAKFYSVFDPKQVLEIAIRTYQRLLNVL